MKHGDVIRHIEKHGCKFLREGGSHELYVNPKHPRAVAIPRHNEIHDKLVWRICKSLRIPKP